jgi:leader peptidase (prepilin peptidase)/N-methyltransferase
VRSWNTPRWPVSPGFTAHCADATGIGLGDAKLLAAAGAWLSWQALPGVVLIATILAVVFAVATSLWRRTPLAAAARVPFGPYLSVAIWLVWLYGPPDLWL